MLTEGYYWAFNPEAPDKRPFIVRLEGGVWWIYGHDEPVDYDAVLPDVLGPVAPYVTMSRSLH